MITTDGIVSVHSYPGTTHMWCVYKCSYQLSQGLSVFPDWICWNHLYLRKPQSDTQSKNFPGERTLYDMITQQHRGQVVFVTIYYIELSAGPDAQMDNDW